MDEERDALSRCLGIDWCPSPGRARLCGIISLRWIKKVLVQYSKLTEDEIKTLVVKAKWFASIYADIQEEVQRLTQRLTGRIKELEDRYDRPLPGVGAGGG